MTKYRQRFIRAAILSELARIGKSRYGLAQQVGMHPNQVNLALSKEHDMRVSTAEKFLRALNLSVH